MVDTCLVIAAQAESCCAVCADLCRVPQHWLPTVLECAAWVLSAQVTQRVAIAAITVAAYVIRLHRSIAVHICTAAAMRKRQEQRAPVSSVAAIAALRSLARWLTAA